MSDVPIQKPAWEVRREIRPGTFRTYAHGYWRPFVVHVMGRTLIGKRALRRSWATQTEWRRDEREVERMTRRSGKDDA